MMAAGVADVIEVVMLASRADAFLGGCRAGIIAPFLSKEDVLELVHAGIGEQQSRVVGGDERGASHDAMASGGKIV